MVAVCALEMAAVEVPMKVVVVEVSSKVVVEASMKVAVAVEATLKVMEVVVDGIRCGRGAH